MAISICTSQSFRRILDVRCLVTGCQRISQKDGNDRLFEQHHQQIRGMSRYKKRHTVQPFWHAAVTRTRYPEQITAENEEFLKEAVKSQYEQPQSPLAAEPWPRGEWTSKSQRCGLVGKKIGTSLLWEKDGTRIYSTLVHISDNHVIRYVPASELQKNEYRSIVRLSKRPRGALVVGADSADPRLFTREYYNMFEKAGVMPKKKLTRFLVSDNAILQPGTPLYATHFRPGDRVDLCGYTIDHGFQGVMKRWNFKGGPAAHGSTKFHRKPGCIGSGQEMAKVMPGQKMPGHMGMSFRTMRGLKIVRINSKFNCIWIEGPIMGAIGGYINLYDSGLHHNRYRDPDNHPPFPTHYPAEQQVPYVDWWADDMHSFSDGTITFEDDEEEAVGKK